MKTIEYWDELGNKGGRRPALVAVVGLVVIAVCYIGVNLLGIGLHSYGWFR